MLPAATARLIVSRFVLDLRMLPEADPQTAVDERPHPVDGLTLALRLELAALGHDLVVALDLGPEGVDARAARRAQR